MSASVATYGVTRRAVLDYLIREADMDGLVIVSGRDVGKAVGVAQTTAGEHIRILATEGVLTIAEAPVGFNRSMNAIQLAESVLA